MKVFKLRPSDNAWIELTKRKYNTETGSKEPWVTKNGSGARHYAVCPACDNPVQIIGLDTDKKADVDGRAMPLHARHLDHDLSFAKYSEIDYQSCPLSNPSSFSGTPIKRQPGAKTDELLRILIDEADVVKYFMEKALQLTISDLLFQGMLRRFANQEGHLYRAINKTNLPYAVLYMAKNQVVASGKPFSKIQSDSPFAQAVAKSKHFFVNRYGYIERKENAPVAQINFFVVEHKIVKSASPSELPSQSILLRIEEEESGQRNLLLETNYKFDPHHFFNAVAKRRRERGIAQQELEGLLR